MVFNIFRKKKKKGAGNLYRELVVKDVVKQTSDAISIVFEKPEETLAYQAGQFLTLILTINGEEVRRSYSFSSSPLVDADPTITIKRVKDGLVSNWLPDNVKAGDRLQVMEASGRFTVDLDAGEAKPLVMVAGGSGITPMLSIIRSLLHVQPESTCTLIYCNRNMESIIFKQELEALATQHAGFDVVNVLEEPPANWNGMAGMLSDEVLTRAEGGASWSQDTRFMLCGPEGMMSLATSLLLNRQFTADNIVKESFVSSTPVTAPDKTNNKKRDVVVRYDNQEYQITVKPGKTILECATDAGIDLPFSCQSGLCTACRGKALSGEVDISNQEGLTQSELDEGYILTCVGHPLSDDVVIEIG